MKVFNISLPSNHEYGVIGLRTLYFIYKRVPLKKVAKFDFKEVFTYIRIFPRSFLASSYLLVLRPRPNVELFIRRTKRYFG